MPIYEYRCDQGHTFEVMQRMADDPVTSCTSCTASVQRVLHPVAVHFKGSGFYTTDYRDKQAASPDASGDNGKGPGGGPDTGKGDADKEGAGSKSDQTGTSSEAKGSTEKQNAEKKGSGKRTSSSSGSGSSSAG